MHHRLLNIPGRWLALLTLLLAAGLPAPAAARTVLDLDTTRQPVALADWGDYWIDTTGKATAAQAAAGTHPWKPTDDTTIYHITHGQAVWVRLTVPPAPDAERWYLEVRYPSINRVSLFTLDAAQQWVEQQAGDLVPVAEWPVPHRYPLMPVAVSAEVPRQFLVRLENPHSFNAPLCFVSESYLGRTEHRVSLILGIYFGLAGLAAMISVLSALSLRDTAYALYAPSVVLMALTQASMTGVAGMHLWPHLAWWNDHGALILPVLTIASLLLFASAVVSLPERSMPLHRAMQGIAGVGALVAGLMAVVEPQHRVALLMPYVALAVVAAITVVVWANRRGDRFSLWLAAGIAPVVLASAFPLARIGGLIPQNFLTLHAMQLAIALELPVLLVILMLRSQQRRENNRRIQGLDRLDPATGLINEHVFAQRLERMLARSQRLGYQSAVLLIEIANVAQIQRDFDRKSAEELPLRVAGRLLSAAREIDSVARLSELRFGMLVEGPVTPEEAAAAGPRIVARCLMPFRDKPTEWVAQVRIVQALVPLDSADAEALLRLMSHRMAAIPADSRRAVFTLAPD